MNDQVSQETVRPEDQKLEVRTGQQAEVKAEQETKAENKAS